MKKQFLFATIILSLITNFSSTVFAKGSAEVKAVAVNTEKSGIEWIGKKVLGQHNGKVKNAIGNFKHQK